MSDRSAEEIRSNILNLSRGNTPKASARGEKKPRNSFGSQPSWKDRTFGADALQNKTFPPLNYLLPGLVPEGLCLLVSRPKLGKSWLTLDIAIATAADRFALGDFKPAAGAVLYLALEDGERRLQRRLTKLLPTFSGNWPAELRFATEWPRSDEGGLADIQSWINEKNAEGKSPRLVVVDTLAQFRKIANGKQQVYLEDYTAISELQRLASKYNVTVIVVHHDRKAAADDAFDTVSGSLGLTGAADTIVILKRSSGAVTLHIRGRDTEEAEKALQFNKATCKWTILGEASEIRRSDERARVLATLEEAEGPLSTTEIISLAQLASRNAADVLLARMHRDGELAKVKRGLYCLPNASPKRKMRQKDRLSPEAQKEQDDNDFSNLSQICLGESARRKCAQCHGSPDGREQPNTIGGREVWLHPECKSFYAEGGGWGVRRRQ